MTKKNVVFALGYSGYKSSDDLIRLLKSLDVDVLVDIRRFPKSKNPQFTRENLAWELSRNGIRYKYMGDILGGYRRGGYERYMETEEYRRGIEMLLREAEKGRVAIMCLEKKSKFCHRRFIIRSLSEIGVEVVQIE